jgi:diketogulonate reductase-like aldo/keto reductase
LEQVANSHNATIQQITLAWLINHENVIAIPKAFQVTHIEDNAAAADINLTDAEITQFYTE